MTKYLINQVLPEKKSLLTQMKICQNVRILMHHADKWLIHQSMDAKKNAWEGDRQKDRQTDTRTDIVTTRPKRPKGHVGEKKSHNFSEVY